MKVVKKTGLVPVISLHRATTNESFGVTPEKARQGLLRKEIKLVPIPSDVETFDVSDPVFTPDITQDEKPDAIEIPEDWETMHAMKQIKLAQELTGQEVVLTDDDEAKGIKKSHKAKDIIETEVKARGGEPPASDSEDEKSEEEESQADDNSEDETDDQKSEDETDENSEDGDSTTEPPAE